MGECLNQKDTYWQFIRGLCIAAVVLIHCPSGMGFSNAAFHSWFTLRQMINFPVATFVFMAGFFVSRQKVEARACSYVINRGGAASHSVCLMEPTVFRRVARRVYVAI